MTNLSALRCAALALAVVFLSSCTSTRDSAKTDTGAAMATTDAGQTAAAAN